MTQHTSRPVIGVTLDSEEDGGGYSALPWYALRQNYCSAVVAAGGLPLPLPHEPELIDSYLDRIDGLMVTGGAFDVDPAMFGAESRHATVKLKQRRTAFETGVLGGALKRDMPVLGICGGQQLLAVVLGGTLIQHIPDSVPNAVAHEQPNPRHEPGHHVSVTEGSMLHRITGETRLPVNSAHHQAVRSVPDDVIVDALCDADGVIEGIEAPAYRFCLGVQWHPEYDVSPADALILKAFVDAARR